MQQAYVRIFKTLYELKTSSFRFITAPSFSEKCASFWSAAASCFPAELQTDDDLLMQGLQQSGCLSLTPTTTVSSPWNLGRNWSPRIISDWLRGRKRHSTLMLHSAGTSAMAQIEGCALMRKMLLEESGWGPIRLPNKSKQRWRPRRVAFGTLWSHTV